MPQSVEFLEVRVCVREAQASVTESLMLSQGALAVTLTDFADVPVLEPPVGETPLWPDVVVCGLFPAEASLDRLKSALSLVPGIESAGRVMVSGLHERDWSRAWQQGLEPMKFGRDLWIVPTHLGPPEPDATVIRLDPGLAFGSGTHPSTRLCLEWIDGQDLGGCEVLDFGCGSGVLAIAAALRGATRVTCVDNDPQALVATGRNAQVNGVADRVRLLPPEAVGLDTVDLVLANILSGTLIELAPVLGAAVRPGGWLVLAGVLQHQADAVSDAYATRFGPFERASHDEWVRLAGRARGSHHDG